MHSPSVSALPLSVPTNRLQNNYRKVIGDLLAGKVTYLPLISVLETTEQLGFLK